VNWFNRPSWSHRAACQSLTTTTQRTWIRNTWYRYPTGENSAQTGKTDLFKDANYWLLPVVITSVILIQILAPFVIYYVLIICCGYQKTSKPFAKADKREEKALANTYKTQLDELESSTPVPENTVTVAELRRIRQELEEEVDQLRARRRLRDCEKRKSAKLFRIASLYYYVSFWLWVIYLIIGFGAKLYQYASLFAVLLIIAIVCVVILPIVYLIESCFSSERNYIKNLSMLTSATERIESIRNTQPNVSMNAECYHYELRTRTVNYTDANGNTHSRQETYQEKVVTAFIVEPFLFTHWLDSSESTLTDVRRVGITKIKMELRVQFGDDTTAQNFKKKFQLFQQKNRYRDVFVNFSVSTSVDGFKKRLATYTNADAGNKPGWIGSVWFWLATFFCIGWPYRIMFNRVTGKTEYKVVKIIFTSIPSTGATASDPNEIAEPSAENSEEDTIDNIKKNVQSIINRLTAGLSANDGEMPIKCAATDQHMNVTLQEDHHAPQTRPVRR